VFLVNRIVIFLGEAFYYLDAPVIRITGVDTPMPYAKSLETAALPQVKDIVDAVNKVLRVTQ
jgi:pyruvate dehydrogenase E1 component beta subunit